MVFSLKRDTESENENGFSRLGLKVGIEKLHINFI